MTEHYSGPSAELVNSLPQKSFQIGPTPQQQHHLVYGEANHHHQKMTNGSATSVATYGYDSPDCGYYEQDGPVDARHHQQNHYQHHQCSSSSAVINSQQTNLCSSPISSSAGDFPPALLQHFSDEFPPGKLHHPFIILLFYLHG